MISIIVFFVFEALIEFLRLFTPLIFNLWLYHVILHVIRFWLTQSLDNEVSNHFLQTPGKLTKTLVLPAAVISVTVVVIKVKLLNTY